MRRKRGITIVECLVSVVIFGIGILAASQCLIAAYDMLRLSEQFDLATGYAQQEIEQAVGFGTAPNLSLDNTTKQIMTSTGVPDTHFPAGDGYLTFHVYNYAQTMAGSNLVQFSVDAHWLGLRHQTYHVLLQTIIPYRISP